jgi:hypothetical protein
LYAAPRSTIIRHALPARRVMMEVAMSKGTAMKKEQKKPKKKR